MVRYTQSFPILHLPIHYLSTPSFVASPTTHSNRDDQLLPRTVPAEPIPGVTNSFKNDLKGHKPAASPRNLKDTHGDDFECRGLGNDAGAAKKISMAVPEDGLKDKNEKQKDIHDGSEAANAGTGNRRVEQGDGGYQSWGFDVF
ncbi:hypothetical protein D9758_015464 [Tetrapyrgos nigripes]|uniref:Uncharacterized protein n=1 Tax=Tetrapyrgos nigripes TaxID=182062 RepID=A0A8H5FPJ7_9AGAR|nr:hypothetical protein D9758_015464 [Tetrapyrgos nigripes]